MVGAVWMVEMIMMIEVVGEVRVGEVIREVRKFRVVTTPALG